MPEVIQSQLYVPYLAFYPRQYLLQPSPIYLFPGIPDFRIVLCKPTTDENVSLAGLISAPHLINITCGAPRKHAAAPVCSNWKNLSQAGSELVPIIKVKLVEYELTQPGLDFCGDIEMSLHQKSQCVL